MSDLEAGGGITRRLWPMETDKFRDHLLRLDPESRRMRFAHSVSDAFIEAYANRMTEYGSLVYGRLADGKVRGAAELRRLGDTWDEAEAAFSVERPYQNHGVGTHLMSRVVRAARNRNIRRLYLSCLADNARMQAIARKHAAVLRFDYGDDVVGEILPAQPDYCSLATEAVEDRMGFIIAVLDLQAQWVRAA